MSAQHNELRTSKLSFMHWPVEWLWIAVIVAVASLVFVGLFLGAGRSVPEDNSVPSSATVETAAGA
ncbi:MAG TPA: hypothetical protein VM347_10830 [Nonomuraea sp.]|nr:hypothetical protein [Nonomuraea sp.]